MAPTGAHGIIGLVLARTIRNPYAKLGLVLGSIAPDLDLTLGMFLVLFGWINSPKDAHRTFSHGFILIGTLGALALLFVLQKPKMGHQWLGWLLLGATGGALVHILMDMLVWTPLPLLWPMDLEFGPIFLSEEDSPGATEDQPPIATLPAHFLFLLFIGIIEFLDVYAKKGRSEQKDWPQIILVGLVLVFTPTITPFLLSSNDFWTFYEWWTYLGAIPLMFLLPVYRKELIMNLWEQQSKNQEMEE
ncbi:MAG: metal-dependent hydrolase [Candidatus Thorarchaeota archaeon]